MPTRVATRGTADSSHGRPLLERPRVAFYSRPCSGSFRASPARCSARTPSTAGGLRLSWDCSCTWRRLRMVGSVPAARDAIGRVRETLAIDVRCRQSGGGLRTVRLDGDVFRGHPGAAAPAAIGRVPMVGAVRRALPVRRPADCGHERTGIRGCRIERVSPGNTRRPCPTCRRGLKTPPYMLPIVDRDCRLPADCDCRLPTADLPTADSPTDRPPRLPADCDCRLPTADRRLDLRGRRLDVDDRVRDLRVGLHQPILDDVREPVGFVERHARRGTRRADPGTRDRPSRAIGSGGSRRRPGTLITTRRMSSSAITTRSARIGDVSRAISRPVRAMKTATTSAPIGSRIGYPSRTAASETSTAHDVSTSLCVCIASASSSSLCSARAARRLVAHDQQVDAERRPASRRSSGS